MTTFLCIGDQHFKISNLPEVELFITKIVNTAKILNPDYIVCLGDLLDTHERVHTTTLNKAYEFIDALRKITQVYVLVGNHDMISNQVFLTQDHWLNGMKEWDNVTIVDRVLSLHTKDGMFVFAPYVFPGRFQEALNTLEDDKDWKSSKCIFAHQEFKGCKMGAIVSVEGDPWPDDFPFVVSGHIHSRQEPQRNIYYTGAAMQHAFGESNKNVVASLEFVHDQTVYKRNEIDLGLPRKRIVYKDISDVDSWKIPDTKDKIKLTLSGMYDEFKALKKTKKYKSLLKNGIKVVFRPTSGVGNDLLSDCTMSDEVVFSDILRDLVANEKNEFLSRLYEDIK